MRSKNSPVLVEHLASDSVPQGSVPVKTSQRQHIVSVCCGSNHTVACTKTGEVYSWGEGRYGALGVVGLVDDQFSPVRVTFNKVEEDPVFVVQASAGCKHTLFLDASGRVHSCGGNDQG